MRCQNNYRSEYSFDNVRFLQYQVARPAERTVDILTFIHQRVDTPLLWTLINTEVDHWQAVMGKILISWPTCFTSLNNPQLLCKKRYKKPDFVQD